MADGTLAKQADKTGEVVHKQLDNVALCPNCVASRHELSLMYQHPVGWGNYQSETGIYVVDVTDDAGISLAEMLWLATFRKRVPSILDDDKVLAFTTMHRGEEHEIIVPHERLAALCVLACHPRPLHCACGLECSVESACAGFKTDTTLAIFCSPICRCMQSNPQLFSTRTTIFGPRAVSQGWDGDPVFTEATQQGIDIPGNVDHQRSQYRGWEVTDKDVADEEVTSEWVDQIQRLDDRYEDWTDEAKHELLALYEEADGEITLQMIANEIEMSASTVSKWFRAIKAAADTSPKA